MRTPEIARRRADPEAVASLRGAGITPLLARIYAARGITDANTVAYPIAALIEPARLRNARAMAEILADAIDAGRKLLIVADYDADGATACALGIRALRAFGAVVDYLVPNRFDYGYGLTPEIVELAAVTKSPDIIITVDNGIASVEGVAAAAALGIDCLITDHHLPGATLPAARCIVNPNQPGCDFPSKHLAGVGVMFYVLAALRAELRRRGRFMDGSGPNLAQWLDLVALGTVADVVRLDTNNRTLVHHGLRRMREGKAIAGIRALYRAAGRDPARASTYDLGFMLGPRLNAAGRLTDMSLGIECLLTDDAARAAQTAAELDRLNRERRAIESTMHASAMTIVEGVTVRDSCSLCLHDPTWHQGVVGILASRIKERFHRPTIAFARGADGMLKGSGRSIPGLHLRDALDLVSKRAPDLIARFGGHAAAAGLTLAPTGLADFSAAFEAVCRERLSAQDLARVIETDGELGRDDLGIDTVLALQHEVWGQGFAPPLFDGKVGVLRQRIVAERHSRLVLEVAGAQVDAMVFGWAEPLPAKLHAVFRAGVDEYGGVRRVVLTIEHWQEATY